MAQLNEEQQERLKQIRERQVRAVRPDRDDVPQRDADPLARALSRELRQAQADRGFLLSLLDSDSQAAGAASNKVVLSSSNVSDAAPNVSCPKCGGTKPTCCSCPDAVAIRQAFPTAISVVEQLYNEWWDNDRRRCLNTILARLRSHMARIGIPNP